MDTGPARILINVLVALLVTLAVVAAASCSTIKASDPAAGPWRCNGMADAAAGGLCDAGAGGGAGGGGM